MLTCLSGLFPSQAANFDLSSNVRSTLSYILIVHPVAAFFTLVMLILSATAHTHKASHSPRYLLGVFILSILTLILSLLAFLVDVLLFVPHMAWGSYMVLAATIAILASVIVSCAMRRTLVSRKARKRRIEENAEMNGENYYNRQGGEPVVPVISNGASVPTVDSKGPAYATFDSTKEEGRTSDERIPLTMRTPSENSPSNVPGAMVAGGLNGGYRGTSPATDQFGNPMAVPPQGYRSRDPSVDPSLRQYPDNGMGGRGGRGMPYRGRGGYGPPPPTGRGGYGASRGAYRGYAGPQRGGYGPQTGMMAGAAGEMAAGAMMRGGRGRGGQPGGFDNRGMSPYGQRAPSADGRDMYNNNMPPRRAPSQDGQNMYNRDMSPRPPPQGQYAAYNPGENRDDLPRAESPPPMPGLESQGPVGQAIEMDATTGSPSKAPEGFGTQYGAVRDSDVDVAGMVGLQQQRQNHPPRDSRLTDGSVYSSDEYVPPRQAWQQEGRSSPLNPASQNTLPAELPSPSQPNHPTHTRKASGDHYYEDVPPQFAEPPPTTHPSLMPPPLAPGAYHNAGSSGSLRRMSGAPMGLDGNNSYEDIQSGSRSPAESDRSNFTSVSQRGINPRWNGGPPQQQNYGPMPNRRPVGPAPPRREDLLLNSNPDFQLQLPGGRGRAGRGGGGAYPTGGL